MTLSLSILLTTMMLMSTSRTVAGERRRLVATNNGAQDQGYYGEVQAVSSGSLTKVDAQPRLRKLKHDEETIEKSANLQTKNGANNDGHHNKNNNHNNQNNSNNDHHHHTHPQHNTNDTSTTEEAATTSSEEELVTMGGEETDQHPVTKNETVSMQTIIKEMTPFFVVVGLVLFILSFMACCACRVRHCLCRRKRSEQDGVFKASNWDADETADDQSSDDEDEIYTLGNDSSRGSPMFG